MEIEKEFPIGITTHFKIEMSSDQRNTWKRQGFNKKLIEQMSENTISYGEVVGHEGDFILVKSGWGNTEKINKSLCFLTEDVKKQVNRDNNIDNILKKEE